MGEFFKGWQRKTGLVTLAMALLLSTAWLRSHMVKDFIFIPTAGAFISFGGAFCWLRPLGDFGSSTAKWKSQGVTPADYFQPPWTTVRKWQRQFIGFSIGEGDYGFFLRPVHFVVIPCWSLVLPLTLLSAWLILRKPRKVKPAADFGLPARDASIQ